jgi:hypothetical protein
MLEEEEGLGGGQVAAAAISTKVRVPKKMP